jgi:hypothetical protein
MNYGRHNKFWAKRNWEQQGIMRKRDSGINEELCEKTKMREEHGQWEKQGIGGYAKYCTLKQNCGSKRRSWGLG